MAAAGKRLDRYSFASLAHSSFGGESWVAVATDAWKGVPRRERPGRDDEIAGERARSVLALDV